MNTFLGETEVKIGEKVYTLRPTFEAIMEMESRAGQSVSELVSKFTRNQVSAKDIACIIYYGGILGAIEKNVGTSRDLPPFEEIGQLMMLAGFMNFLSPAMKILLAAYSGKRIDDVEPSEDQKKSNQGELSQ